MFDRTDFENILSKDNGELRIAHSLSRAHVDLHAGAKTSVRLAAQTFSLKTAAAIEYLDASKTPHASVVRAVNDVSTNNFFLNSS